MDPYHQWPDSAADRGFGSRPTGGARVGRMTAARFAVISRTLLGKQ
jgi:hypothetical protein